MINTAEEFKELIRKRIEGKDEPKEKKKILFKFSEDVGKFPKGTIMLLDLEKTAEEYSALGWGELVEEEDVLGEKFDDNPLKLNTLYNR